MPLYNERHRRCDNYQCRRIATQAIKYQCTELGCKHMTARCDEHVAMVFRDRYSTVISHEPFTHRSN